MSHPSGGRLAELTRAAVVRVAALTGRVDAALEPAALAAVLYRAGGCVPDSRLDPRWVGQVVTAAERAALAGLAGHTRSDSPHWHSWTATDADPSTLVHKIYVSPAVRDSATTLGVILTHAPLLGVPAWKVGADLAGVHRPDKIVLYLASAERADRVATALALMLEGLAAQGVPFTGQVGQTGMVSRGRDVAGTSWRAHVCRLVAHALWASRAELGAQADAIAVADRALDQLAAEGLDVRTWHPTAAASIEKSSAAMSLASAMAAEPKRRDPVPAPPATTAGRSRVASARRPRVEVSCS